MNRQTVELDLQSFTELVGSRCVAYRRILFPVCGHNPLHTLFLSQAYYWQIEAGLGRWWFATRNLWFVRTGLKRDSQESARKFLKGFDKKGELTGPVLLEERLVQNHRGHPQLAFRIDAQALAETLNAYQNDETVKGSGRWPVVSPDAPSVGGRPANGEEGGVGRKPKCDGQSGANRPRGWLDTNQQGGGRPTNRVAVDQPTGWRQTNQQGGGSTANTPSIRVRTRGTEEQQQERQPAAASSASFHFTEATSEDRERLVQIRLAEAKAKGTEFTSSEEAYANTIRSLPSGEVMFALVAHDQRAARRAAGEQKKAEAERDRERDRERAKLARRAEDAQANADRLLNQDLDLWYQGLGPGRKAEIDEAQGRKTRVRLANRELASELDGQPLSKVAAAAAKEHEYQDLLETLREQPDAPGAHEQGEPDAH